MQYIIIHILHIHDSMNGSDGIIHMGLVPVECFLFNQSVLKCFSIFKGFARSVTCFSTLYKNYLHYLYQLEYKLAKLGKNLSQEQIKIRVLAYLYNRGDIGANAYTIQHRTNIPQQDYSRFRSFLEELCSLSLLQKYEEQTGGEGIRLNYRITYDGRRIVEKYRDPLFQKIFGSIEDLFD